MPPLWRHPLAGREPRWAVSRPGQVSGRCFFSPVASSRLSRWTMSVSQPTPDHGSPFPLPGQFLRGRPDLYLAPLFSLYPADSSGNARTHIPTSVQQFQIWNNSRHFSAPFGCMDDKRRRIWPHLSCPHTSIGPHLELLTSVAANCPSLCIML
jgi:hypothetical protein